MADNNSKCDKFAPTSYVIPKAIGGPYIQDVMDELHILSRKIDALQRKMDMIFGNNVLINGRFRTHEEILKGQ